MSLLPTEQQNKLKKTAAISSICLAILLTIIKTIGVFYTGSLAVLSSMIDSFADLFASSVTYFSVKVSSQPADFSHRYGHGKAEALSALIQSAFIMGSGLFVMYDGINRFINPTSLIQTSFGIIIMIICLILTTALIIFQHHVAKLTHSQAIRADAAHYGVDIITNISIILSLIIVKIFDIIWFDTITALIVSIYLIFNAGKLAKDAIALLMDKELSNDIREKLCKLVLSCDHVEGLHDLRTRDLGGQYMFELHLELDGNLSLFEAHRYSDDVENKIKEQFPNSQVIIHQDPAGLYEKRLDEEILSIHKK
ncbi:MAG: cation diffusion facilitator family transporter [Alphaproteobacteria bacterium]|nr:cation diffusion facilitator family transporter [Alphaproteobacteria bacterium]